MIEWRSGIQFEMDTNARLTYTFDWSDWLPTGVKIASHTTTASSGISVTQSVENHPQHTMVSVMLHTPTGTSTVACRITTDETPAQIDERTIKIRAVSK